MTWVTWYHQHRYAQMLCYAPVKSIPYKNLPMSKQIICYCNYCYTFFYWDFSTHYCNEDCFFCILSLQIKLPWGFSIFGRKKRLHFVRLQKKNIKEVWKCHIVLYFLTKFVLSESDGSLFPMFDLFSKPKLELMNKVRYLKDNSVMVKQIIINFHTTRTSMISFVFT